MKFHMKITSVGYICGFDSDSNLLLFSALSVTRTAVMRDVNEGNELESPRAQCSEARAAHYSESNRPSVSAYSLYKSCIQNCNICALC